MARGRGRPADADEGSAQAAAAPAARREPVRASDEPNSLETRIPIKGVRKVSAAAVASSRRYPHINASWDGEENEIVLHHQINLGIAAATPRGLLVPNIKDAGQLALVELADAVTDLVRAAREGRSTPEDMARGTITITNIGHIAARHTRATVASAGVSSVSSAAAGTCCSRGVRGGVAWLVSACSRSDRSQSCCRSRLCASRVTTRTVVRSGSAGSGRTMPAAWPVRR